MGQHRMCHTGKLQRVMHPGLGFQVWLPGVSKSTCRFYGILDIVQHSICYITLVKIICLYKILELGS